jgi:hypothetical protein
MAKVKVRQVADFTGGLNFRADQFQLKNNESPDMLNVEIDPRGGVFSRGAQQNLNTTAVSGTWTPRNLFPFYGATNTLMLKTATRVYKCTNNVFTTLDFGAGTPIVSSNSHGASLAQWGDSLYIAVGTSGNGGYVWKTTDTYATALTASGSNPHPWQTNPNDAYRKMPTAEYIYVHANKMFAANTIEAGVLYPNRLRWSLENAPENWASDDYIDVNGGGNGITGLSVVNGNLVIFKPRAIYVLFGYNSDTFQIVELSSDLGIHSKQQLAQTENGVYFYVRNNGIYFYNGSSIKYMFDNLKPIFDNNYVYNDGNDDITLSWINRRVWLSLPYSKTSGAVTDATINFILDPDINDGVYTAFQHHDGKGLIGGCDWTDSSGNDYALMLHPTSPYVIKVDLYEAESDSTSGTLTPFTSYYRTKWQDGGNYVQKKMWRRPDFVLKESAIASSISVKVFHDFAEGSNQERRLFSLNQAPEIGGLIWGTGKWGENWSTGAVSSVVVTGNNLGLARTVQIEFSGPLGQRWGINSIGYKFQSRSAKG